MKGESSREHTEVTERLKKVGSYYAYTGDPKKTIHSVWVPFYLFTGGFEPEFQAQSN